MINYLIKSKPQTILNLDDEDVLITVNKQSNTIFSLDKPSITKKPWIVSLNNVRNKISINLLSNLKQNMIIYLNGSDKLLLKVNACANIERLNIIMISENTLENEDLYMKTILNENTHCSIAALVNNNKTIKKLDFIINHNNNKIYSDIQVLGLNSKGVLKIKANTIINHDYGGCRQSLKILNLHKDAKSECDPTLTIKNNNIDYASHGATISNFNSNHLFYLQAKGLPLVNAKKLLLESSIRALLRVLKNKNTENFITSQFMLKVFK